MSSCSRTCAPRRDNGRPRTPGLSSQWKQQDMLPDFSKANGMMQQMARAAFCAAVGVTQVFAAEVDQFTLPPGEPVQLPDSALVLQTEVNRLLRHAIQRANERYMESRPKADSRWLQPRCDETRLYDALTGALARSEERRVGEEGRSGGA